MIFVYIILPLIVGVLVIGGLLQAAALLGLLVAVLAVTALPFLVGFVYGFAKAVLGALRNRD